MLAVDHAAHILPVHHMVMQLIKVIGGGLEDESWTLEEALTYKISDTMDSHQARLCAHDRPDTGQT